MAKIRVLNSVGATVTIDGIERESVTVDAGTTVHWKVSKEGYVTQEDDYIVWEDTVLPVVLKREEYTITFNVSPTDATLTVNGSAVKLTDGNYTMTAKWGDTVSWTCQRDGHIGQSGNFTASEDRTVDITLEEEVVILPDRTITFIVEPTHSKLVINGTTYQQDADTGVLEYIAHDGDVLEWEASYDGFVPQSGSHTVNGDATVTITLEEEVVVGPDRTIVFEVSPEVAKLTVNGEEMRDRGTYPMIAHDGDVLEWSCECDGYVSQNGTHTVDGDAEINIVLEAEGEIYTLSLTDSGTAPWSGDSNHEVRWSQPGCKKYLYELDASTTLGSVKSVTDIGDPYDNGEINGEIVLNIPANTATGDKTGTLTVRGYDKNGDLMVKATVGLTQDGGPGIEYPTNVEGTDGTNFNLDSLALSGEREYTFRIRTSEYVEKVHISPIPAYGDHGYGYEYGISSVTLNGVTVGTSGGSVSVEGGKEYDVTVKFHNYHTHPNTGANPVTGAYYGCEYSIYFTPSYGEYTGSEQEFVIYTSNASSGPVTLNTANGIDDATE